MKLIKKKTLRSINIKINRNQKNENQTQNKYKPEDTTEFLKAWHKYKSLGEKKKVREKKLIAARLAQHATLKVAPQPCASDEIATGFFFSIRIVFTRLYKKSLEDFEVLMHTWLTSSYFIHLLMFLYDKLWKGVQGHIIIIKKAMRQR